MANKRARIPETRETKPNREQRRHPERLEDAPLTHEKLPEEPHTHGPQDAGDPRAK